MLSPMPFPGRDTLNSPPRIFPISKIAIVLRQRLTHFSMSEEGLMDERQRYAQGMTVRRAVLGDAHVDATLKNRDEFNETFQDLVTRYAWGEIWTRPGLPKQTRSMLTLAMMVAMNRADEFRMHVRAALNNGVTREEIQEVLLQTAIYCGVPAANSAFHIAQEVFAEL